MEPETLNTLIAMAGGGVILPFIGIGKHFVDKTWLEPYVRWEVITGLGLIGIAIAVCSWLVPTMTTWEMIKLGLEAAGTASMVYGGTVTARVVINKNNHETP